MVRYLVTWFRTTRVSRALQREDGQDLAEYALLIALIAVVLVLVVGALSGAIANIFNRIREVLNEAQTNQIQVG
ncbi:MAG: Flp family type IVb pilin [Anaerolineae bacterium]|nr:Flp family type IVb pilin [Anaerolineae bacterium]